jgi:hypothetical protein
MANSSFSSIQKTLAKLDRDTLLSLVRELYGLSTSNRNFLEARFLCDDSILLRYKKLIDKALYPNVMSSDTVSFRDARKIISDYRKAQGRSTGLAELMVYAAERGNQFTCDYGDIDSQFYTSLELLFESAVKAVLILPSDEAKPFIDRLYEVVEKANGIGWGYHDFIAGIFSEAFPDT